MTGIQIIFELIALFAYLNLFVVRTPLKARTPQRVWLEALERMSRYGRDLTKR
jgi:hypothetical protein